MPRTRLLPRTTGRLRLGLVAICLAQFLALLDGLIVSVALPAMSADLGLTPAGAQWALNAYGIPFAGLLLLGGRLADVLGRRRAFAVGQVLLVAGSLIGGAASSGAVVYLARAVQATGAALALPSAVALLAAAFPDKTDRTKAFALLVVGGGIGWVSAGLLGGISVEYLGWRSVFLVTIPVSVVAIVLARLGLPPDAPLGAADRGSLADWPGALLVAGALGTVVFSFGRVEQVGWLAPATAVGLLAGLVLGIALILRERRVRDPVLKLDLLRLRQVRGSALLGLVLPVGFVGSQFLGSLYLQEVLGYGPGRAGIAFVPLALMPLLVNPLVARLHPVIGPGPTIAVGFALTAAGLALLALSGAGAGYLLEVLPGFVLIGIGVTLVYVPLGVASVDQVPESDLGLASAVFSTSNQVGGALALAVLASVIAAAIGSGALANAGTENQLAGLRVAFLISAGLCLLGAAAAAPLLRRPEPVPTSSGGRP